MNPANLMILLNGTYIMVILNIMIDDKNILNQTLFASFLSIFIGFLLKITKDWSKEVMSGKKIIIQMIFSFGLGYFAFLYSLNKEWDGVYKQLFYGFISFISAETVTAIEDMAEKGIKKYMTERLNSLIAKRPDVKNNSNSGDT